MCWKVKAVPSMPQYWQQLRPPLQSLPSSNRYSNQTAHIISDCLRNHGGKLKASCMTSTMSLTEQLWDVVEHHENADHKAAAPVPSCQSIRKSLSALLNEHHGVQANEAANECIFYDVENISLRFSTVKKHLNFFWLVTWHIPSIHTPWFLVSRQEVPSWAGTSSCRSPLMVVHCRSHGLLEMLM